MGRDLWSRYRSGLLLTALFAVFVACDPGGCSSCAGCGVTPIPGGFPLGRRIPNAGQVRLTESGVAFVESNMSDIVDSFFPDGLSFPVPRSESSGAIICPQDADCDACSNHECWVDLTINSTSIDSVAPNILRTVIRVRIETRGLDIYYSDLEGSLLCLFGDGPLCDLDVDSAASPPDDQGFTADIVFNTETRTGYTKVDVVGAALTDDLQPGDIDISDGGSCGLWCTLANLEFIKDFIIGSVQDQLAGQLTGPIQDQLCRTCIDDGQCVGGLSACVSGVCEWNDDGSCVPWLLGTEGRIDLGGLLASITPGLSGVAQFTFASGGDGEADGDGTDGLNLNFNGGFDSLVHNECVPALPPPDLPVIPLSDDIRSDTLPDGATTSMTNIGIAESYLNFASFGVFDSGMLCIGATPALAQQLATGFFSLAVPSLDAVAFPSESAAVAMQLRPQLPPVITVGAEPDPLLSIYLENLMIDFYVFSRDRYVRFMTVEMDMTIDMNLQVDADGILPQIDEVLVEDVSVTNSRLLADDAADVADVFESIVGLAVDLFLGTLQPFALPPLLGFSLEVPEGGITMTESSGERFLSIFANLAFDPDAAGAAVFAPETFVALDALDVDPEAFDLGEGWEEKRPVAHLSFDAAAPSAVEWSYRIDGGTWSRWSPEEHVSLAAPHFMMQGRHTVEVRSRLAGQPRSADSTPASVSLLVDTRAPRLELLESEGGWTAEARDIVSGGDLGYSWRIADGEWSEWSEERTLVSESDVVAVRVRDEAGNVSEASSGELATAGIIRGGPSTTGGGACECRAAGPGGSGRAAWGVGALLLGVVVFRRRKAGAALLAVILPFALTAAGCDCGGKKGDDDGDAGPGSCLEVPCDEGAVCCESSGACVDVPEYACDPGFACAETDFEDLFDPAECTFPTECTCEELPALDPGIIGSHTDFALASDGTMWVSGYAEGDVEGQPEDAWGDLVVGTFESESSTVGWQVVDGVPTDGEIGGSVTGWRGGIVTPGDDVGLFTSIAVTADGEPRVTYYDRTNGDLKFAALGVDDAWDVQVVDDVGDTGRYSSLVLLASEVPAVSYVGVRPDGAVPGGFLAVVRFARGDGAIPGGWDVADVSVGPMPCRAQWCGDGEVCTEAGTCQADEGDACGECASGEACVAGACTAILEDDWVDDWLPGYGHTSMALDPAGDPVLAFYDRSQGNLMMTAFDGAAWSAPAVVAGFDGVNDTCDCGLSVSLFVDGAGGRHATFVDGWSEALMYWSSTGVLEEVDQRGYGLLGDDSSLVVTPAGEARVAYQDATDGTLVFAVRTGAASWTPEILDGPGAPDDEEFSGFHAEQLWDGAQSLVGTWWINYRSIPPQAGVRVLTR